MRQSVPDVLMALALCASALSAGAQEAPVVLFPFREATVAAAVDAELKDYGYKIGEPFTNGAVVARLDDARYRVSYLRASEHRAFTARVAKEQKELRAKDFTSEMELRKAEYEAKLAEADCLEAEINLSRCTLVAPFGGKIAELLTRQYETVKPGQPLFRIIEDSRLLAVANLPLGSVSVGRTVTVVPEGGAPVGGTVYEVSPQADNRTGTVRVRVLVENARGRLTAGMTGVLRFGEKPSAPKPVAEKAPPPPEPPVTFLPPGRPYATVQDAFSGVTPYVLSVTNRWRAYLAASNYPAAWRGREVAVASVKAGVAELHALPSLAITGLCFRDGLIGYVLHRYPRVVTLTSVKRVGEATAGIYDEKGTRLVHLESKQVELPASGGTLTNAVWFAPASYDEAVRGKGRLKLIFRVESDVRVMDIEGTGGTDGGN